MAGRKPEYTVRARTGRRDAEDRDILVQCGVGWKFRDGEGINIQINTMPVLFDGALLIFPARDDQR
jgi:hypothetical protein